MPYINNFSRIHCECATYRFTFFDEVILRAFYVSDIGYRTCNLYVKGC